MRVDVSPQEVRRGHRPERILGLLAILAVGVVLGAALGALRPAADGTVSGLARTLVDGPVDDRLPQLQLDVHFRALQTLRELRETWASHGLRAAPEPNAVPAALRVGEKQLEIGLALQGPAQSRGPGQLGRLLVDVHGEGNYAGMRSFVLEDPAEPLLLRQVILAHELARAHAIAPRTLAVGVRVNGARWGTAVLVEPPSLALLQTAGRPVGALVGWETLVPDGTDLDTQTWLAQPPAAHWSTGASALRGTPLEVHTAWAQARLDAVRAGQMPAADVLDVDATARLLALAELTGLTARVVDWQRLRWYLNPQSLRLEPVVALGPELPGPQVRADALLPLLLRSPPIAHAFATHLRAEAERVLAHDAEEHLAKHVAIIWPTLTPATWQREWLVVRQRAARLLAAESLAIDAPLPVTPSAAVLAPTPPTSEVAR